MTDCDQPVWKLKPGGEWAYVCPDCGTDDLNADMFRYWCPSCEEPKEPAEVERYLPPAGGPA